MKTKYLIGAAALSLAVLTAPVVAQMKQGGMDNSGHGMGQGEMQGGMHGNMHGDMQGGMHGNMQGGGMGGMTMGTPKGDDSQSSRAYAAANAKMHQAMDIIFTGDSDVDFVKGMIAHHQGAIDMAEVVLEHGKDEKIRQLAQEIIKAQRGEIAMMQQWLADKGK